MHERRHASDECVAVEDVDDILDPERAGQDSLAELDADFLDTADLNTADLNDAHLDTLLHGSLPHEDPGPGRYLPPPSVQAGRAAEPAGDAPEPEHPLARRAKLAALVVATAMVIASIIVAAIVTGESDESADQTSAPLRSGTETASVSFFTVTQPF